MGGWLYYDNVLRFTDDFTDCPVAAFRAEAKNADAAVELATEERFGSLAEIERCSLDCEHGNHLACALYGVALEKGVFVMESEERAREMYARACGRGEALGCELEARLVETAEERERAAARERAREESAGVLARIERRKAEVGRVMRAALEHFGGSDRGMTRGGMLKWYRGTIRYLLYDKPLLSQFHSTGTGDGEEQLGLKDFVLAKYLGGQAEPDVERIEEFFEKLMRLGVRQIRLDYRVENKKDSEIPASSRYWKAMHTFLYNAGQVELEILEMLEGEIRAGFEDA